MSVNALQSLHKEVKKNADEKRAQALRRFFKTGKGEYGEGDVFIGLTVPVSRQIAQEYKNLSLSDLQKLIKSKIHEERVIALAILTSQFAKADEKTQENLYNFYLSNTKYINNWDLVDLSCHKIVGPYLDGKNKAILSKLARSKNIWERRIAVISTFYYIAQGKSKDALKIATILRNDKHDLIHKAVGWMLREVGKRCGQVAEEKFLKRYYKTLPRTMLRYAIERFPEQRRRLYLESKIK